MFLGKFRKHIEEIRHKHPRLNVDIRMPSHFSEYFTVHIFDGDTFLHAKRVLTASDLDSYNGDSEDLLITILDYLVEEIEKEYKEHGSINEHIIEVRRMSDEMNRKEEDLKDIIRMYH